MRLLIFAGPPSAGKTTVVRQVIRQLGDSGGIAFLKIDVVRAFEDEEIAAEFGILPGKSTRETSARIILRYWSFAMRYRGPKTWGPST